MSVFGRSPERPVEDGLDGDVGRGRGKQRRGYRTCPGRERGALSQSRGSGAGEEGQGGCVEEVEPARLGWSGAQCEGGQKGVT